MSESFRDWPPKDNKEEEEGDTSTDSGAELSNRIADAPSPQPSRQRSYSAALTAQDIYGSESRRPRRERTRSVGHRRTRERSRRQQSTPALDKPKSDQFAGPYNTGSLSGRRKTSQPIVNQVSSDRQSVQRPTTPAPNVPMKPPSLRPLPFPKSGGSGRTGNSTASRYAVGTVLPQLEERQPQPSVSLNQRVPQIDCYVSQSQLSAGITQHSPTRTFLSVEEAISNRKRMSLRQIHLFNPRKSREIAMTTLLRILFSYPKPAKRLLADLVLDRRVRYPNILPYYHNRRALWEYIMKNLNTKTDSQDEEEGLGTLLNTTKDFGITSPPVNHPSGLSSLPITVTQTNDENKTPGILIKDKTNEREDDISTSADKEIDLSSEPRRNKGKATMTEEEQRAFASQIEQQKVYDEPLNHPTDDDMQERPTVEHHEDIDISNEDPKPKFSKREKRERQDGEEKSAKTAGPEMITVTDFDDCDRGIQILVVPEPFDEDTMMSASICLSTGCAKAKQFAVYLVDLYRTTARLCSSEMNYANPLLRKRAHMLRDNMDMIKNDLRELSTKDPLIGALLAEYGALNMVRTIVWGYWHMVHQIRQEVTAKLETSCMMLDLSQQLGSVCSELKSMDSESPRNAEGSAISLMTEQRRELLDKADGLMSDAINMAGDVNKMMAHRASHDEVEKMVSKRLGFHVSSPKKVDRLSGKSAEQFAPGIPHILSTERVSGHYISPPLYVWGPEGMRLVSSVRDIRPKTFFRPLDILGSQLGLDALDAIGAFRGKQRGIRQHVLPEVLPFTQSSIPPEALREPSPEESWNTTTVSVASGVPGRIVQCHNYGLFSWSFPRQTLAPLQPIRLALNTDCYLGYAHAHYIDPYMINEKWRQDSFVRIYAPRMGTQFADALVQKRAWPPMPPRSQQRNSTRTRSRRSGTRGEYDMGQMRPNNGGVPVAKDPVGPRSKKSPAQRGQVTAVVANARYDIPQAPQTEDDDDDGQFEHIEHITQKTGTRGHMSAEDRDPENLQEEKSLNQGVKGLLNTERDGSNEREKETQIEVDVSGVATTQRYTIDASPAGSTRVKPLTLPFPANADLGESMGAASLGRSFGRTQPVLRKPLLMEGIEWNLGNITNEKSNVTLLEGHSEDVSTSVGNDEYDTEEGSSGKDESEDESASGGGDSID